MEATLTLKILDRTYDLEWDESAGIYTYNDPHLHIHSMGTGFPITVTTDPGKRWSQSFVASQPGLDERLGMVIERARTLLRALHAG